MQINDIIDFSTKEGQKIFEKNTAALYTDKEKSFDLKAENFQGFISRLAKRSKMMGWDETIMSIGINITQGAAPELHNLIKKYGIIDKEKMNLKIE